MENTFKSDDYKEGQESKGFGDTIAKFTHAFRINKVAEAIAKIAGAGGCGCKERRELLNQLFPYKHTVRKFKILRDITATDDSSNEHTYVAGDIVEIKRGHELFGSIIEHQLQGTLEEL